jgi:hypothetical protein
VNREFGKAKGKRQKAKGKTLNSKLITLNSSPLYVIKLLNASVS